jgi:vacuolar-type H+-ATPase subunit D/Vma8
MGLFRHFSTKHKLNEVLEELELVKRTVQQLQQEWDATSMRVSKVLRRLARTEQAVEGSAHDAADEALQRQIPLTTVAPSGSRLAKIREQLAARGKGSE